VLNRSIPALFDEIVYEIGPQVEIIAYAISGSRQLVENVAAKLDNDCLCYLIQNHGALCLGATMDDALKNAELLEKEARVYYYALASGREITPLPPASVDHFIALRKSK
jgi:L-fuculose-phosphate aldolase